MRRTHLAGKDLVKQLALVLSLLVLGLLCAWLAWSVFGSGWAVAASAVIPALASRPVLKKVRAMNRAEGAGPSSSSQRKN